MLICVVKLGRTAFHMACVRNSDDVAVMLADRGCNIDAITVVGLLCIVGHI